MIVGLLIIRLVLNKIVLIEEIDQNTQNINNTKYSNNNGKGRLVLNNKSINVLRPMSMDDYINKKKEELQKRQEKLRTEEEAYNEEFDRIYRETKENLKKKETKSSSSSSSSSESNDD